MVKFLMECLGLGREERERRRKAARSFEEHQEIKQIAEKLLKFLRENAEKMPWGKVDVDWTWPEGSYWLAKYFGHHQTKTKRIELKLDRRHYNYHLIISHQEIVDGQMRPMIRHSINTEQTDYIDNKGKVREDKELKQIFEEIFSTVVSVYKKRADAKKTDKATQEKLERIIKRELEKDTREKLKKMLDRELENQIETQILRAIHNNKTA